MSIAENIAAIRAQMEKAALACGGSDEALAEQLSVTPDYFTKLFRDSIGKTTVDYVNCVRINAAMAYLVESKLSISETSLN